MGYRLIFDPSIGGKMQVACFVSGSGTNSIKIIERGLKEDSQYRVTLIFTDVRDNRLKKSGDKRCKAMDISNEYGIGYECVDIRDFYKSKGHKNRRDLSIRPEFDKMVLTKIRPYEIDLIANAGYMSIMTPPILEEYNGRIINVHPADLSIMKGEDRKYVGIHVVDEAILAGERELRSTTHIVREKVDHGEILVISEPIPVKIPNNLTIDSMREDKKLLKKVVSDHQELLKVKGDWKIFPLTVQMIAQGRFGLDGEGGVCFDGEPLSKGYVLSGD